MAKGPLVTDKVEVIITSVYRKHTKWKALAVRNEVSCILRKENPELSPKWPSLSTVQKVLAKVRKPKDSPQDKPWSTATLDRPDSYPISSEALPVVFKVWKFQIEKGNALTIRQAKWTARLSKVVSEDTKSPLGYLGLLSYWAGLYARTELMFDLIDRPFDSTELDRSLMGLPVDITTDFKSFFWLLAEQQEYRETREYIDGSKKEIIIKDGVEQIREVVKKKRKGGKSK